MKSNKVLRKQAINRIKRMRIHEEKQFFKKIEETLLLYRLYASNHKYCGYFKTYSTSPETEYFIQNQEKLGKKLTKLGYDWKIEEHNHIKNEDSSETIPHFYFWTKTIHKTKEIPYKTYSLRIRFKPEITQEELTNTKK